MTEEEAQALALEQMTEYGLIAQGWKFELYKGRCRFIGYCDGLKKTILFSDRCLDSDGDVKETILHEIAHALTDVVSKHGHDNVWKAKAQELGCKDVDYVGGKNGKKRRHVQAKLESAQDCLQSLNETAFHLKRPRYAMRERKRLRDKVRTLSRTLGTVPEPIEAAS